MTDELRPPTTTTDSGIPAASEADRDHLVTNIVAHASDAVSDDVQQRVVGYWTQVDPGLGARVATGLGHGVAERRA